MNIRFDSRLSLTAPQAYADAVRTAAAGCELTVADFIRSSLSREMRRLGIEHPRLPIASKSNGEGLK